MKRLTGPARPLKRHPSFAVVAGWGLLNGLLLAVLAIYGEAPMVFWLWGGVVAVLELAALAALLSSWRGPEQQVRYQVPDRGAAAAPVAAVAAAFVALAIVYGLWLLVVAVPLFLAAAALAVRGTTARER